MVIFISKLITISGIYMSQQVHFIWYFCIKMHFVKFLIEVNIQSKTNHVIGSADIKIHMSYILIIFSIKSFQRFDSFCTNQEYEL